MSIFDKLANLNIFGSDTSRSKKNQSNALQMYLYRVGGILINFLYVPIMIDSLNVENYGIWLTITSITAMMSFFDVGLGNGMRNRVAECLAKDDKIAAREYISTTYVLLSLMALFLIIAILVIVPLFDWRLILNAPNTNASELKQLIIIVFSFYAVQLVLHLLASLFNALQNPAKSALVLFLTQLLGLIVVFLISRIFKTESLLIYGVAISCSPVLVFLVLSLFFFKNRLSYLSPSFRYVNWQRGKGVVNMGFQYFLIQLTAILMFQSNNFIIAHCVDVSSVIDYNIAYKYVSVPMMGYTILTAPLWSATTDAYTRGDFSWIRQTIKRMLMIGLFFQSLLLFLVIISPIVYKLWLGDSLSVNWLLLIILALYQFFSIFTALFCMVINGIGKIRLQFVICFIESIVHIPLTLFLSQYIGLYSVAISLTVLTAINAVWEPIQIKKILNNEAYGIWNK